MPSKNKSLKIDIAYGKPVLLSLQELNEFQGDLKDLPEEGSSKLTGEIIGTGFAFAPHAWLNPRTKKWMLIDGHQRVKVLRKLEDQGYDIPKIPTVPIVAKTFADAKRRVLQGVSQYGKVTKKGLFDFIEEAKIKIDDVITAFDLPTIDLVDFKTEFFEKEVKETIDKKIAKDSDNPSKLVHTCPECGHEFS